MNKAIVILAILVVPFFTSCKSAQQKENAAKEQVVEAKQDLIDTKVSNANDWLTFKAEAEAKIKDNEQKISKIKVEMNKPDSTFDGIRRTRIEKLEAKNAELKSKLSNYDGNETEWKTFQSDFNREMKEIGDNIKDLFR